jgi:hypothetical protein
MCGAHQRRNARPHVLAAPAHALRRPRCMQRVRSVRAGRRAACWRQPWQSAHSVRTRRSCLPERVRARGHRLHGSACLSATCSTPRVLFQFSAPYSVISLLRRAVSPLRYFRASIRPSQAPRLATERPSPLFIHSFCVLVQASCNGEKTEAAHCCAVEGLCSSAAMRVSLDVSAKQCPAQASMVQCHKPCMHGVPSRKCLRAFAPAGRQGRGSRARCMQAHAQVSAPAPAQQQVRCSASASS